MKKPYPLGSIRAEREALRKKAERLRLRGDRKGAEAAETLADSLLPRAVAEAEKRRNLGS